MLLTVRLFLTLAAIALPACTPVQVAPTVTIDRDFLGSRTWNVAVFDLDYEFEGEGTLGANQYLSAGKDGGRVIAGLLTAELSRLDQIQVIERERLDQILEEQALQQSGLISSETAREVGRLAGADAVIIGELTDYVLWSNLTGSGSTISFSFRMIETESGRVLMSSAISRARAGYDSFANAQTTARELIDSIRNYKS